MRLSMLRAETPAGDVTVEGGDGDPVHVNTRITVTRAAGATQTIELDPDEVRVVADALALMIEEGGR